MKIFLELVPHIPGPAIEIHLCLEANFELQFYFLGLHDFMNAEVHVFGGHYWQAHSIAVFFIG